MIKAWGLRKTDNIAPIDEPLPPRQAEKWLGTPKRDTKDKFWVLNRGGVGVIGKLVDAPI